jgi:hypothetical protein
LSENIYSAHRSATNPSHHLLGQQHEGTDAAINLVQGDPMHAIDVMTLFQYCRSP